MTPTIRHATYDLLSRLFLAPPDGALLEQLATLPPFDGALHGVSLTAETVEAYQVAYQELFGFNFFPYESLFHERELMVNTAGVERLRALMEETGFDHTLYAVGAADHLGVELAFMAYLIAREIAGEQSGQGWMLHRARAYQATLLYQHLATWVPMAMLTMQGIAPTPLFHLLAEITLELVLSDVTTIPATDTNEWVEALPISDAPPRDENEDDGLSSLIRHLITPFESGVFLTRIGIRRMARQLHLPMTMGDRFGMVKQLFEAAGQFEKIEPLVTVLEQHWTQTEAQVVALMNAAPLWRSYGDVWLRRLGQGRGVLADLHKSWEVWEGEGGSP
jgi:putative dimethyl sulfoxide reductase chaperone